MRLVIDLQGAQTASAKRGIGRYTLALAEAMVRSRGQNEVFVALNANFPERLSELKSLFGEIMQPENIVAWNTDLPVASRDKRNIFRQRSGEIIREAFLSSLKPDFIHAASLFEGVIDDAVTSVGLLSSGDLTAVTLYDLIPLTNREAYLANPLIYAEYMDKIEHLKKAGLLFSISESSKREAIDFLGIGQHKIFNISAAASEKFKVLKIGERERRHILSTYGIQSEFVLYAGALDPRKNVERLCKAYAMLSLEVRRQHQLVLVCAAGEREVNSIYSIAEEYGLRRNEILTISNIPDSDLILLYNMCKVFCLPSMHEGFGLPALEAMQCGAPVIGSDRTSIPEVIGRTDALFDPSSERDIARMLTLVLTDDGFRGELMRHGVMRAKEFSWAKSAQLAWDALQEHHERRVRQESAAPRPRLAYISPLPGDRTGIADYSGELLPALAEHYEVDAIVLSKPAASVPASFSEMTIEDFETFKSNYGDYERVIYQIGNSVFHTHMLDSIAAYPGVITLHDFFLSGVSAHLELAAGRKNYWKKRIYESHGYSALTDYQNGNHQKLLAEFPANAALIMDSLGTIVHSDHAISFASHFYDRSFYRSWRVIPQMHSLPGAADRLSIRAKHGFGANDFLCCCFGMMADTKLNHRLLLAWLEAEMDKKGDCHLIFVGEMDGGEYGDYISNLKEKFRNKANLIITGFCDRDVYEEYLAITDIAVQLRAKSRGESSRAILDCMAYGIPSIANSHGSMAELPSNCVFMLADQFSDTDLADAIVRLRSDQQLRNKLGAAARAYVESNLAPRRIAERYRDAIEEFYASGSEGLKLRALKAFALMECANVSEQDWLRAIKLLDQNLPSLRPQRQLLVDVSANVLTHLHSGIERVVRNQLIELLRSPPRGFRVEPIYLFGDGDEIHYRYARAFTSRLLGLGEIGVDDDPVDVGKGDIFFGADYAPVKSAQAAKRGIYSYWRSRGVSIRFQVYDLLPIKSPEFFPEFLGAVHEKWLSAVSRNSDQLICISRAVAVDVLGWLDDEADIHADRPLVSHLHLGADFDRKPAARPKFGKRLNEFLRMLERHQTFLMVGTVEPRKGHADVLSAFEYLWNTNEELLLVIVGTEGWKGVPDDQRRTLPSLIERLRTHPRLGKNLFWLEDVSDAYLDQLYRSSTCLIAASEGEGFGLPIIEAAQHGCPVLARDIPVFREVAGSGAAYFSCDDDKGLEGAIRNWLDLRQRDEHPKPEQIAWMSWSQNVEELKSILLTETQPIGPDGPIATLD
ncbi:MAG: glycosyltransferase [Mesorhizobium sp.]|nr:MAG: glycosyltransferase [Mesorhizobium sp.]